MIQEIKELYSKFSDARIDKIEYNMVTGNINDHENTLTVYISCFNIQERKWESVKLECSRVTKFKFADSTKIQSSVVFEALLEQTDTHVVLDFFPIQVDGLGKLKEDPDSSFLVHCSNVNFRKHN